MKEDKYLITGCRDNELRVWSIMPKDSSTKDSENAEKVVPNTEGFVTGEESGDVEGIVSSQSSIFLVVVVCSILKHTTRPAC